MDVEIDFYSDWIDLLKSQLLHMGYSIPSDEDPRQISIIYFNATRRRIRQAPRTVRRSREFACPHNLTKGLQDLEQRVSKGEDLNAHLSRKLKKARHDDDLLNDWGIYHFHLGESRENDGFVQRTGPVLFALVTSSHFYGINIYGHGNWTNLQLVEIVHSNWPETIERFRLRAVTGLSRVPTSGDIKALRGVHVNAMLQTKDGTIYAPIGGGYAIDGTGIEVVIAADRYAKLIRNLEQWVRENIQLLVDELREVGFSEEKTLTVKLEIDESAIYAACPDYGTLFTLKKLKT